MRLFAGWLVGFITALLTPGEYLAKSRDSFGCYNWVGGGIADHPKKLRRAPQQRTILSKMSILPRLRNPELGIRVQKSKRQLDIQVWSLREKSGKEI